MAHSCYPVNTDMAGCKEVADAVNKELGFNLVDTIDCKNAMLAQKARGGRVMQFPRPKSPRSGKDVLVHGTDTWTITYNSDSAGQYFTLSLADKPEYLATPALRAYLSVTDEDEITVIPVRVMKDALELERLRHRARERAKGTGHEDILDI